MINQVGLSAKCSNDYIYLANVPDAVLHSKSKIKIDLRERHCSERRIGRSCETDYILSNRITLLEASIDARQFNDFDTNILTLTASLIDRDFSTVISGIDHVFQTEIKSHVCRIFDVWMRQL